MTVCEKRANMTYAVTNAMITIEEKQAKEEYIRNLAYSIYSADSSLTVKTAFRSAEAFYTEMMRRKIAIATGEDP
jgi:hypothetical protein